MFNHNTHIDNLAINRKILTTVISTYTITTKTNYLKLVWVVFVHECYWYANRSIIINSSNPRCAHGATGSGGGSG